MPFDIIQNKEDLINKISEYLDRRLESYENKAKLDIDYIEKMKYEFYDTVISSVFPIESTSKYDNSYFYNECSRREGDSNTNCCGSINLNIINQPGSVSTMNFYGIHSIQSNQIHSSQTFIESNELISQNKDMKEIKTSTQTKTYKQQSIVSTQKKIANKHSVSNSISEISQVKENPKRDVKNIKLNNKDKDKEKLSILSKPSNLNLNLTSKLSIQNIPPILNTTRHSKNRTYLYERKVEMLEVNKSSDIDDENNDDHDKKSIYDDYILNTSRIQKKHVNINDIYSRLIIKNKSDKENFYIKNNEIMKNISILSKNQTERIEFSLKQMLKSNYLEMSLRKKLCYIISPKPFYLMTDLIKESIEKKKKDILNLRETYGKYIDQEKNLIDEEFKLSNTAIQALMLIKEVNEKELFEKSSLILKNDKLVHFYFLIYSILYEDQKIDNQLENQVISEEIDLNVDYIRKIYEYIERVYKMTSLSK